jgi:two-component system OmpR family sensor kinase
MRSEFMEEHESPSKNASPTATITGTDEKPPLVLDSSSERIAQLEAAVRARDQMISVLGHQLRNALAPLVLVSAQFDGTTDRRFALLTKHLHLLESTIDRISELSQLRDGALVLDRSVVDLGQVVTEAVAELAREASAGTADVRVVTPPNVTGVWDRCRVRQIVGALLHNAISYGGGGLIEIVVDASESGARIVVQDSGPGIPESQRAHLFEAFDHAVEHRRGRFGVGLWIARTLARAMNGDLRLEESDRTGSRFCLTLGHGRAP